MARKRKRTVKSPKGKGKATKSKVKKAVKKVARKKKKR